jgi:hypothetical protein
VMEAHCAYAGCVARVIPSMPAEHVPYVAPYERTCDMLRDNINREDIPTLKELVRGRRVERKVNGTT